MAMVGLTGFWASRDVARTSLTAEQQALVNPAGEQFHASFVVAGRDYTYHEAASPCRWEGATCIRDRPATLYLGHLTDTILYVNIAGDDITAISIPRDIWLPQWQTKINAMYGYQGAEGLKRSVEEIVGVPIDYYAVVSIDIFEELVDAVGGVEINIPYDMYYRDSAAGLLIDFDAGPAHLDGAEAAKFVRYRNTQRSDFDRMDNVKRLAYALLDRVKELNVRAVGTLPALVDTFFDQVETNASPALVRSVLPRLTHLSLTQMATLPVHETQLESGAWVLEVEPEEVEAFLAETIGGTARSFASPPSASLLVTNRSGVPGLEEWYQERLVALGVPEELILVRTESYDPTPTRVLVTGGHWSDADYYSQLLDVPKQQVDRLPVVARQATHIELVLGQDAGHANDRAALGSGPEIAKEMN